MLTRIVPLALMLTTAACTAGPNPETAAATDAAMDHAAVSAASRAHIEAWRANDLAGIGAHMAPNVVVSGTGELDVRGAAAAMAAGMLC